MTSAFCLFVFETFVSRLLALFGTIITSESGNPTRPGDKWERKLLVFGIFYSFLTSGRPLSSSTAFNIFYWIYIFLPFYHLLKGLPHCHEQVSRTKTYHHQNTYFFLCFLLILIIAKVRNDSCNNVITMIRNQSNFHKLSVKLVKI